jgi:flagellar biosynthetic protein FliQ
MTESMAIDIGRQAVFTALVASAPALILGLAVGVLVSIFQAITSIQEATLAFIPKIVVIGMSLLVFGPFMLAILTKFTAYIFTSIPAFSQ